MPYVENKAFALLQFSFEKPDLSVLLERVKNEKQVTIRKHQ